MFWLNIARGSIEFGVITYCNCKHIRYPISNFETPWTNALSDQ